MSKNFMIIMIIGVGGLYFLTNVIGEIKDSNSNLQSDNYRENNKYNKYYSSDSIGQDIIDATLADNQTQLEAWRHSSLKVDFIELFPNFDEMKIFIKERVRGTYLINRLNSLINNVEEKYLGGSINVESAKRDINNI